VAENKKSGTELCAICISGDFPAVVTPASNNAIGPEDCLGAEQCNAIEAN